MRIRSLLLTSRTTWGVRSGEKESNLPAGQRPVLTGLHPAEPHGPDTDPAQSYYRMKQRLSDPPYHPVLAFVNDDAIPAILFFRAQERYIIECITYPIHNHAFHCLPQILLIKVSLELDQVLLFDFVSGVHDSVGESAVVRKEHKALRLVIKSADGKKTFIHIDQGPGQLTVFVVHEIRQIAGGLVQSDILKFNITTNFCIANHYDVFVRCYTKERIEHNDIVYFDIAGFDNIVGFSA